MKKWIIALCIAALTLVCFGCGREMAPEQETVAADWDECHLYYGLKLKEATLDTNSQNGLGELIYNYSLEETSWKPIPAGKFKYGGPYILTEFIKDGVTYEWHFGPNLFVKRVTEGSITTVRYYEVDRPLLNHLQSQYCQ